MTSTYVSVRFKSLEEICDRYLASAPLSHALFRTAEAKHVTKLALECPVLEVGCGSGQFAEACVQGQVYLGIDLWPRQLAKARCTGRYANLQCADARALPLADAQFRSVLAVSVLEHIGDAKMAVSEIFRVLQAGGYFIATVPLADFGRYLFWSGAFAKLGMPALARVYVRAQHWCFRHKTLLSKEQWEEMLVGSGFEVLICKRIVSPKLTMVWDLLLVTALPHVFLRLLGLRRMWRPRWLQSCLRNVLLKLLREEETDGSDLFFVARKASD